MLYASTKKLLGDYKSFPLVLLRSSMISVFLVILVGTWTADHHDHQRHHGFVRVLF